MAMALPKQEEEKILQLVCDNAIAEIRGKNIYIYIGIVKRGMAFGNAIATIPFHFFFFFKEMISCTQFLQYFHNKF